MNEEDNIVDFDAQAERIKNLKKKHDEAEKKKEPKEPLFNLHPAVKLLAILILVPYFVLEIWSNFNFDIKGIAYMNFGFVPAQWDGHLPFTIYTPISLITYNFLHGGLLHIGMNTIMLLAFATGVAKFLGGKRMFVIFFVSSLAGVFSHYLFYIGSPEPVIGASAGLSGLFGALIVMMQRTGMMPSGPRGIWPFVFLWVFVSILFGMMGTPDGHGTVAWIAHLGGFFAGIALMQINWFIRPLLDRLG